MTGIEFFPYTTEHVPIDILGWLLRTFIQRFRKYGQCCSCIRLVQSIFSGRFFEYPKSSIILLIKPFRFFLWLSLSNVGKDLYHKTFYQVT